MMLRSYLFPLAWRSNARLQRISSPPRDLPAIERLGRGEHVLSSMDPRMAEWIQ